MTQRENQIRIELTHHEFEAVLRLARRCGVSPSHLCRHAIRQLLIRASTVEIIQTGVAVHPDHARSHLATLGRDELDQLNQMAIRFNMTPTALGQVACRELLDLAARGAVPNIKIPPSGEEPTAEELREKMDATQACINEHQATLNLLMMARITGSA